MPSLTNAVVGRTARPISGYTTKVKARMIRCRRQCVNPRIASEVDSRAP